MLLPWGWQTQKGSRALGNPADLFWVHASREFVVLHNKRKRPRNPDALFLEAGHKEVYRGPSRAEAMRVIEGVAAEEGIEMFDWVELEGTMWRDGCPWEERT